MFRLTLYPIADSFALVIAVAIALLLLMFVFRVGKDRMSRRRRAAVAGLRLATIVLLILCMLRPTIVYTKMNKQSATLAVMIDDSRSMTVPDMVGSQSRFEALRKGLAAAEPALKKLAREGFEIKAYAFDAAARPLSVEKGTIAIPEKADGTQTAIGNSLDNVLSKEAGKRLLGVVLLSDGNQRPLPPNDMPPQTPVARMKNLGYPLFTVLYGQSRGLGQAQDIAVREMLANPNVFVKNPLAVSGQIRVDGFVNREVTVQLLFETSPGKMEVVGKQTLQAASDGQLLPVEFEYVPDTPGEFKLTLEAVPQPGELVTTNNRLSSFVNVLKGGLNVLYLEGTYRVEQKFIRRALDASQDIHVDYVRLDARDKLGNLNDLFKPGKYDVYILGDIDSTAFSEAEMNTLAETVNGGAGLIMLGGFHNFGAGGYAESPLDKVLPVGIDRLDRQRPDEPFRKDLHLSGPLQMRPTAIGQMHFAMRLAEGRDENLAAWEKLPPLDGVNTYKFRPDSLAKNAVVLADAGEDRPLLVAHNYGNGRVLAFAGSTTWHWWMRGFEPSHKRFWRQIVLWLAKKDESLEGSVGIKLEQRRFAPMQRVDFSVSARDPSGEPLGDAEIQAEIVLPDGNRRPISLVKQNNQATGSFRDTLTPGDYAIEAKVKQKGQDYGSARARFVVFQQDLELDNASADADAMNSLAAMTADVGGKAIAPEELAGLIEKLAEKTSEFEVPQETKSTFWDTWPYFLALVLLLSIEWFLRKRWGMV
jgi:uncharacterized membrane protein